MSGGPLFPIIAFAAFIVGFLPGIVSLWLRLRKSIPEAEWAAAARAVVLGRIASALAGGLVIPGVLAGMGLAFAAVLKGDAALAMPAVLGGWVANGQPAWVGSLALVSSWVGYALLLLVTSPLEQRVEGRLHATFRHEPVKRASIKARQLAHAVQGAIAVLVSWRLLSG